LRFFSEGICGVKSGIRETVKFIRGKRLSCKGATLGHNAGSDIEILI